MDQHTLIKMALICFLISYILEVIARVMYNHGNMANDSRTTISLKTQSTQISYASSAFGFISLVIVIIFASKHNFSDLANKRE